MATTNSTDTVERWAKQSGLRGGGQQEMFPRGTPSTAPIGAQTEIPMAAQPKPVVSPSYTPPPVNPTTGGYVSSEQVPRSSPGVQGGGGLRQAGKGPAPVQMGEPAAGVQANRAGVVSAGRSGVFGSVREGVGTLRAGLNAQPGPISKSTFLAGKVLSSPLVAGAGRLAGGVGLYQNLGDYKINDPDVDSSAQGTWSALRSGNFAQAGRSLSKGALEAGMDLGSFAANTADYVVPGKAPVSTAYDRMLRSNFGDQLADNSGAGPGTAPASATPNASNSAPGVTPAGDATGPGQDPGRPGLRQVEAPPPPRTELLARGSAGFNAANKQMDSGAAYTPGDGQGMLRSSSGITRFNTPQTQGQPASQDFLRRQYESAPRYLPPSLTSNPGAPGVPESRSGLRPSSGTGAGWASLGGHAGELAELRANRLSADRAATQQLADTQANTSLTTNANTNQTSLRTTEMNNDTNLRTADMTKQSALARMKYDMAKDERAYKTERYDKHLEQDAAASKRAGESFSGLFDTTDKDGKVVRRTDLEAQAAMVANRASGGKFDTMSPQEQAQNRGNAVSYVSILESARNHQNNGWMQALGVDSPDAPRGGLPTPEELQNGKMERVGIREGASTPNAGKGDWVIRLPNGQVMYLGSDLSGEHLKYLQNQGVK